MFAGSLCLIAKRRREIFFIAEHDIHIGSDAAVDFLGPLLSTDRTPQGIAIIQVIGDDAAVCPRSEHPRAARTPNPRSVKFSPLRTVRPTPSYSAHRISEESTPPW